MKHLIAFQNNDPSLLRENHAVMQSQLMAMIEDMMLSIVQKGVALEAPAYGFSKEGFELAEYRDRTTGEWVTITELKAHPLLKPLFDLLSKNNLSLADLNMTPQIVAEHDEEMGRIKADEASQENIEDYQRRQTEAQEKLISLIQSSQKEIKNDPVLVEYEGESDG